MHINITVERTNQNTQTHSFANIVDTDISFYDDIFWSRIGYADFTLKLALDPIKKQYYSDGEIGRFSQWWHNIDKDVMPKIFIELFNTSKIIASGYLFEWEENKEDFEVSFTCVDKMVDILEEQVNRDGFTIYSDGIEAKPQPTGPGVVPGTSFITYEKEIQEFFWKAICQWWNSIRGEAPELVKPLDLPPNFNGLSILSTLVIPINHHLQQSSNEKFRILLKLKKITNLERKQILSDLSKLTQSKIVCKDGIHFIAPSNPINITGYVQSIKSSDEILEIEHDRLIDSVVLQRLNVDYVYDDDNGVYNEIERWNMVANFTAKVLESRFIWLNWHTRPRTEYHIWGYVTDPNTNIITGVLQSGFRIKLDNTIYKIKEISYESDTINSLMSFDAVCTK